MKTLTRKDFLKVSGAGLGALGLVALTGCSSSSDSSSGSSSSASSSSESTSSSEAAGETAEAEAVAESSEPVELVVVTTSDPGGLSPYGVNRGGKQCIRAAIYEPLFWIDENKNMCSVLGKSYEYKGDGVYGVEIFDYIYDSEGNPLTAADVVFSLDAMIEEGHAGSYIGSLTDYYATGDYTVEFVFADEDVGNFETLATYLYCVTQVAWEEGGDDMVTTPVGSGLYTCTDYVLGSEYTLEAREDYWQTDADYICAKNTCNVDTLVLKVISDTSTIAISLENREIDYTMNIEDADRGNFINDDGTAKDGYIIKELATANLIRLSFNCSDLSPCADINLRKAIATCIDSASIAYNIEKTYGYAAESLVNPSFLDADESLNNTGSYYDYDADAAKALVEQSSYNNETLRLLVQTNDRITSAATLVQAYCRAIGIEVELIEYESAVYNDYFNKNDGEDYDMTIFGINSTNSYIWKAFYELDVNQFSNGLNQLVIYDETLQELYDIAASAATNSTETANDLIQYVTDQCYEYAIFYYDNIYVGLDRIQEIVVGAGNGESIYNAFVVTP